MQIFDTLHAFLWKNPTANNCNTYLIDSGKKILIDPGHFQLFGHVKDHLARLLLSPEDIDLVIITHCHPDHMEGIKSFEGTATLIAVSAPDMDFIRNTAPHYRETLGIPDFEPDILLQDGDLVVGDVVLKVIHTPGHSPGSVCLYWQDKKVLFTGDVIFNQGVGRTDLPGGNGQELKQSIKKISSYDIQYLLPGHGDIISGGELIKTNFAEIERDWFAYL